MDAKDDALFLRAVAVEVLEKKLDEEFWPLLLSELWYETRDLALLVLLLCS